MALRSAADAEEPLTFQPFRVPWISGARMPRLAVAAPTLRWGLLLLAGVGVVLLFSLLSLEGTAMMFGFAVGSQLHCEMEKFRRS